MDTLTLLDTAAARFDEVMPSLRAQEAEQLKISFLTYGTAFKRNFCDWLYESCRLAESDEALIALADNLHCELVERHPRLLEQLLESLSREVAHRPDLAQRVANAAATCQPFLNQINWFITQAKSVEIVTVLALLERTSIRFIAEMDNGADILEISQGAREYLRRHGEADQEHATKLAGALLAEIAKVGHNPSPEAVEATLGLLEAIFRPA